MKMISKAALASALALGLSGGAMALPLGSGVGGSHVSSADFTAASIGGTQAQWAFLGSSTAAFTLPGTGEVELRLSEYGDSFGFSGVGPAYANKTQVFSTLSAVGSTAAINPGFSPFVLYFESNGGGTLDANLVRTDGSSSGTGASQAGIDIFYNATLDKYAFFYDDAGGSPAASGSSLGGDDNDFNDLVVTYKAAVPEPATLALFGAGLLGLGLARRRRRA